MYDNAEKKITDEMDANKSNGYIQAVGHMLLGYLSAHPDAADKILAEGKTIAGSLEDMRNKARKKQTGNCAVLTDQEGFTIVLKYFGLTPHAPAQVPAPSKQARFEVSLDDLL
ncbi:MAG: hypothetical protein GX808_03900 [Syntrophomonadaceae bacterium]|nr:hypothetical protein [Syntrophomonadaceae bacterium]